MLSSSLPFSPCLRCCWILESHVYTCVIPLMAKRCPLPCFCLHIFLKPSHSGRAPTQCAQGGLKSLSSERIRRQSCAVSYASPCFRCTSNVRRERKSGADAIPPLFFCCRHLSSISQQPHNIFWVFFLLNLFCPIMDGGLLHIQYNTLHGDGTG